MIFDFYSDRDVEQICRAFDGKIIGFTSGSYDLKHIMHDSYLSCCRRHCGKEGILIVGVDSDHLIRQRKGPTRPYIPEVDRLFNVAGLKCVDAAFILGTVEDFGKAAESLNVRYIFKNQDYVDQKVLGADLPGVELVIVPDMHQAESTTEIVNQILRTKTGSDS